MLLWLWFILRGLDKSSLQFVNGTVDQFTFFFGQIADGLFSNQNQRIDQKLRLPQVLLFFIGHGVWYFTQKNHGLETQRTDIIKKI